MICEKQKEAGVCAIYRKIIKRIDGPPPQPPQYKYKKGAKSAT